MCVCMREKALLACILYVHCVGYIVCLPLNPLLFVTELRVAMNLYHPKTNIDFVRLSVAHKRSTEIQHKIKVPNI